MPSRTVSDMKASGKLRRFLILDLTIGILVAATVWNRLGMEGMAAMFCESIHVDRCDEVDWSEEYDRDGHDESVGADEEAEGRAEKDPTARRRVGLRAGS
ncbi:MAG: hypothetical protein ACYTBS_20565 [Planctomycetota bacterium]